MTPESEIIMTRLRELEGWKAEHDGRNNEKWRQRDDQDRKDVKWQSITERRVSALESSVKLLAQRVAWVSALGGTIAGVAFQTVIRLLT